MRGTWMTSAVNLGILLAVLGSALWVADAGVDQSIQVLTGDDGNVTALTYESLGQTVNNTTAGDVDIIDRVVVGCMVLSILTAFGVLGYSRRDPKVMKMIIRYYPLIGLAVGLSAFGTQVAEILQGQYDFSAQSDGLNALHIAITGWVLSGFAQFFK